ncbi:DUF4169 family protein [Hoeflea sp. TYP-13]|uniref:DUF4169 family protein n=1 Tax=Hoeflea sp. TYP-13 TaxID=3230023 RepID=UPI0034C5C7CC
MGADLVNLRQFKKRKARQEKEAAAERNRIAFGRTRAEKSETRKINEQQDRAHEQGRLEKPDNGAGKRPPK